jgi:hypothetical protein
MDKRARKEAEVEEIVRRKKEAFGNIKESTVSAVTQKEEIDNKSD